LVKNHNILWLKILLTTIYCGQISKKGESPQNMVFKIQGDLNEDNFDRIFIGLQKYFTILLRRGTMYIALQDFSEFEEGKKIMKRVLKPARDFYVGEINQNNISREEQFVMEWCRDALVKLDRQRYELEKQERLKLVDQALDRMEEILEEQTKSNHIESESDATFNMKGDETVIAH